MQTKILTLSGYGGSGEKHWQSLWEKEFNNIQKVEQDDWDSPQLALWVERLNSYIEKEDKVILVAHSLACSLISHWALKHNTDSIIGALLVSPMPLNKLPFKNIVVASDNDPYVSLERADFFANAWGSRFINMGSYGHINAESGLSSWEFGKNLVSELKL